MFQMLSDSESEERMLTIMQSCLPDAITSFLTPDTDGFTHYADARIMPMRVGNPAMCMVIAEMESA
jgi:hypothetical protein